jgi:alpha-ribazole phosphatase/probable phosphoglycerate mutase
VSITIVFETHSTTEDNERGIATGWLPGRLSSTGREQAKALGARRRDDGIDAVFTSDLARAIETATIAFEGTEIPVLHDWRLRECDYGPDNGTRVHDRPGGRGAYLDEPYPGGESWRQAVARVGRFVDDLPLRWSGSRVLVIGHTATRWAFEHLLDGKALEELVDADFQWREGWEFHVAD